MLNKLIRIGNDLKYTDIDNAFGWNFLLNEKNEQTFLFPFWRYLEFVWEQNYSCCIHLVYNSTAWKQDFRKIIAISLQEPLLNLVRRTLVWEFNVVKKKQPNVFLKDFILAISESKQLAILLKKYPVLHEVLRNIISNHARFIKVMISRLQNDFDEIQGAFGLFDFKLSSFKLLGDNHCTGSRVALLILKNALKPNETKKIVYKPRSIGLEKEFNNFLKFINQSFLDDKPLNLHMVIEKGRYGWMEYAEHLTIEVSQATDFYYKFGILLGVCFSLNAQDLHFENVIASGVNPAIVDLECLFTSPLTDQQQSDLFFHSI